MRWLALVLVAGCNQIFGVHDTVVWDAPYHPDAPGCSAARFQVPVDLGLQQLTDPGDPELSDLLHLWFSQTTAGDRDIWSTQRASVADPFDPPTREPNLNATDTDMDPAVSADGLDMFFVSYRSTGAQVYEATRPSIAVPFGTPLTVPQTASVYPAGGLDLSSDGLTLFVVDHQGQSFELVELYRPSRDQPFGAPSASLASNVSFPSVSPDQIELFFTPADAAGSGTVRLIRTSAAFGTPFVPPSGTAPEPIISGYADPDVTADAAHLVVEGNGGFSILTRTCN